jgi:hypothetical protein
MALEQKYPPHVEIIQTFSTVTASPVTPVLMACPVGPCYTVVDATEDGSTNSNATITLPAFAISTLAGPFTGLGGKSISIKYKGYGAIDVDFLASKPNPTVDQVVETINGMSAFSGLIAARKIVKGSSNYLMIYSVSEASDDYFSFVTPTGSDGTSLFGFDKDFDFYAYPSYSQFELSVPEVEFPDPLGVLSESTVDDDSVRVFLQSGSDTLVEAKDDETILDVYKNVEHLGDVDLSGLTFPDDLFLLTFELTLSGGSEKSLIFFEDIIHEYNTFATNYSAHIENTTYHALADTTNTLAYPSLSTSDTAATVIAAYTDLLAMYEAHDTNTGGVYHVGGSNHPDGSGAPASLADCVSVFTSLKATFNTHIADIAAGYHGAADTADVITFTMPTFDENLIITEINDVWTSLSSLQATTNYLKLSSSSGGITIGDGTANTVLGLTNNDYSFVLNGVDDSDGDNYTPIIRVDEANFSAPGATAVVTGTADLSALTLPTDLYEKTFIVSDGRHTQTYTFYSEMHEQLVNSINEILTNYPAHISSTSYHYAADTTNTLSYTSVTMATSIADLITVVTDIQTQWDAHDADAVPTWHGVAGGSYPTTVGAPADIADLVDAVVELQSLINAHLADVTGVTAFHKVADTVNISTETLTDASTYTNDVITPINDMMGAGFASENASHYLVLTSADSGYESQIVVGAGTANTDLGLTAGTTNGTAYPPKAGYELWSSGALVGTIVEVMPGGHTDRIRLDTEVAKDYTSNNGYIKATNLIYGTANEPTPDLYNDGYQFYVKHDILRDGEGNPVSDSIATLVVSYKALRLDVTSESDNPTVLEFSSSSDLEDELAPINTDNPLALGIYYAMLNAPNSAVAGLGVAEVSDDYPEGTLQGYTDALELLEGFSVYGLVPLSQESIIHSIFKSHVDAMSETTGMKERVAIINIAKPTKDVDTLVISGTDGESGSVANEFETKLATLSMLLTQQGLNPSSLAATDGVYLDVGTDAKRYNISEVSGTIVKIRVTFTGGGNEDGYFTTDSLPTTLVQENFSIYIKGADLSTRTQEAQAYNAVGKSYADRRVWLVVGPSAVTAVDGTTTAVAGYYLACGVAGKVSALNPAQPMNSMSIAGFTEVQYVSPYYKDEELNHIAAGGGFIIYTPKSTESAIVRHALTTDISTIKKESPNVTTALDFSAMYLRRIVKTFVGKYIINSESKSLLSMLIKSGLEYLVENEVLISAEPGNPTVSSSRSDKLEVSVNVEVGIPGNVVSITLIA